MNADYHLSCSSFIYCFFFLLCERLAVLLDYFYFFNVYYIYLNIFRWCGSGASRSSSRDGQKVSPAG